MSRSRRFKFLLMHIALIGSAFAIDIATARTGMGQDVHKQLKQADKAAKNLDWKATELYQIVLDNPAFANLRFGEQLGVFYSLCWDYYVEEKYSAADVPCENGVRLWATAVPDDQIPKADRNFVSRKSSFYAYHLKFVGLNELALQRAKDAERTFGKCLDAVDSLPFSDSGLRWECLVGRGRAYYHDKDYSQAIPLYDSALDLTPAFFQTHMDNAAAKTDLANMLLENGNLARAQSMFLDALKIMNSETYRDKRIKTYDLIRLPLFDGYAKLLHKLSRNEEAQEYEVMAKTVREYYK